MKKSLIAMSCLGLMLSTGTVFAQGKGGKGKGGAAGTAAKGKEVFESNCSVCHNADSEEKKMGPGLKGVTKRAKIVNGEAMNDANLTKFINEGGNSMPAFADILTTQEKADIMAYLKTL
jgi:mono/diheme cytochrome c family protein